MSDQNPRHSVSVAGVVVNAAGNALLIRRRDNSHWEPPGGILEADESIEQGVCREVREETGLEVRPLALTGVYKNMVRGVVALVFRCEVIAGDLTPNDEATAFHWASEDDVTRMTDEAFAIRVLDALHGNGPAVRHHDGVRLL